MNRPSRPAVFALLLVSWCWAQEAQLRQAENLEAQAQYGQAAQVLLEIPSQYPNFAKKAEVLTRAGANLEKANSLDQAHEVYQSAVRAKGSKHWEGEALLGKASVCTKLGCADEARAAIARLKREFPDSTAALKARILEARSLDRPTADLEAMLEIEEQVTPDLVAGLQQAGAKQYEAALTSLRNVLQLAPDAPVSLRALEAQGNILSKLKRPEEAAVAYRAILDRLEATAPESRIVLAARVHLAAIDHKRGRRDDAIRGYEAVLAAGESQGASRAALQVAGLSFELAQRAAISGEPVPPERWNEIRQRCSEAVNAPGASAAERIRAELMALESLAWEGRHEELVSAADELLTRYEPGRFKQDIAMVRFFAGESAQRLGLHEKALDHYQWILRAYPPPSRIWASMDHLPRTHFRIWETLRLMKAPEGKISAAAKVLLKKYPDTSYAQVVRIVTEQEARHAR